MLSSVTILKQPAAVNDDDAKLAQVSICDAHAPVALPAPPYASEVDLTPLPKMWFEPRKMLRDDWLYELPAEARIARIILMLAAFHEVPAGSLPDRDGALQRMVGVSRETWLSIKADTLSGWTLCADGRWYCRDMQEQVLEAWRLRQEKAKQLAGLRERKAEKAKERRTNATSETSSETSFDDRAAVRAIDSSDERLNATATATTTTTANSKAGSLREPAAAASSKPNKDWPGFEEDDRTQPGREVAGVWMSDDRCASLRKTYPHVAPSAYLGKLIWVRNNAKSKPMFEELERLIANDDAKAIEKLAETKIKAEAEAKAKAAKPYKPPLV